MTNEEFEISWNAQMRDARKSLLELNDKEIAELRENFAGLKNVLHETQKEVVELREKLAAQQARISELKSCLLDIGSGKGDWAWEEVAAQEDGTEELAAIKAAEYQRGQDSVAETYRQDPVGYVRIYGVECLQGTLMNGVTGRVPLPSSTTIDPYKLAEDDISLYAKPFPQQKPLSDGVVRMLASEAWPELPKHWWEDSRREGVLDAVSKFARKLEAAHGITGEKK